MLSKSASKASAYVAAHKEKKEIKELEKRANLMIQELDEQSRGEDLDHLSPANSHDRDRP